MPEYIDREALIAEINEEIEHRTPMYTDEQNDYIEKGLRIARKDIKRFSAADVVEVVRCKNCKHFCPYEGEEHKGDCAELVGLESCVYEDDFCSYGERKDGEENGL